MFIADFQHELAVTKINRVNGIQVYWPTKFGKAIQVFDTRLDRALNFVGGLEDLDDVPLDRIGYQRDWPVFVCVATGWAAAVDAPFANALSAGPR